MGLVASALDRYIRYWGPYARSHDPLDADRALQEEVRQTDVTLLAAVQIAPESTTRPGHGK